MTLMKVPITTPVCFFKERWNEKKEERERERERERKKEREIEGKRVVMVLHVWI